VFFCLLFSLLFLCLVVSSASVPYVRTPLLTSLFSGHLKPHFSRSSTGSTTPSFHFHFSRCFPFVPVTGKSETLPKDRVRPDGKNAGLDEPPTSGKGGGGDHTAKPSPPQPKKQEKHIPPPPPLRISHTFPPPHWRLWTRYCLVDLPSPR